MAAVFTRLPLRVRCATRREHVFHPETSLIGSPSGGWPTISKRASPQKKTKNSLLLSIDHRQKIRTLPKRYFGLYLLVGGRKRLRPMILTLCSPSSGDLARAAWFFPDHRQKIFRTLPITGNKYFVLYLTGSLVFPDHRQRIFRTLPQMAWGGEFFSSDIMWCRISRVQSPSQLPRPLPPGTWPKA